MTQITERNYLICWKFLTKNITYMNRKLANAFVKFKSKLVLILGVGLFLFSNCISIQAQEQNFFPYLSESKKISMEFKSAGLDEVLRIFSHQTGLNFIAATDISNKTITLFLDNVPVDEALERILYANNLTYEQDPQSGIFVVKELKKVEQELITRIYRLKYATTSNSKLNSTIAISGSGGSSSGSSGGALGGGGSSGGAGETSGGIAAALQNILSSSGKIVEDQRTNSLVISDIPSQFQIIEQTLARLDVPVPQILIEVEMLDVSKTTADKIGVKYGDTPLTFQGAERQLLYPWDQNQLLSRENPVTFLSEYTPGKVSATGLTATLQFLRTQSDTRNLARPRILTLNNETAEIKIATDEAIGVRSTTTSSQGTANSSIEAERVETGVFLTVTPQANLLTGEITLAISPRVIQARAGGTFEGKTFKDPEERGSQSILKVYSGDTIMLGGLLRSDYTNTITKLPILGDLPFIGGAFRHKDDSKTERELVIFITPHIVRENTVPQVANQKRSVATTKSKSSLNKKKKTRSLPANQHSKPINKKNVVSKNKANIRQHEIDKALSTIEDRGL